MSMVMLIWLCPRSSCTTFGCTPMLSKMVAALCLRSWKRISGSPALFKRVLKRSTTLEGLSGVPTVVQKTRPRSCHVSPAWRRRCCLSSSTTKGASAMLRRLFSVFGSASIAVARPAREDAPDVQCIMREVNVLPLEGQDLPSAHPSRESQHKERLHIVPPGGGQQLLGLLGLKRLNLKVRPS